MSLKPIQKMEKIVFSWTNCFVEDKKIKNSFAIDKLSYAYL
jgi:hypothetical protein